MYRPKYGTTRTRHLPTIQRVTWRSKVGSVSCVMLKVCVLAQGERSSSLLSLQWKYDCVCLCVCVCVCVCVCPASCPARPLPASFGRAANDVVEEECGAKRSFSASLHAHGHTHTHTNTHTHTHKHTHTRSQNRTEIAQSQKQTVCVVSLKQLLVSVCLTAVATCFCFLTVTHVKHFTQCLLLKSELVLDEYT